MIWPLAIAVSLAHSHLVTMSYRFDPTNDALQQWLPSWARNTPPGLTIEGEQERRRGSAWADWIRHTYDVSIQQGTRIPRFRGGKSFVLCDFPFQMNLSLKDRAHLKLHAGVIANSHFTARWIAKRWGQPAEVVYPVVEPIERKEKRPFILAVGRFVDGHRSKRQLELVDLFKTLRNDGLTGWELHLAGSVTDEAYFRAVQHAARGAPIHLYPNAIRPTLENLYARAAIFWHAVGVGDNESIHPDRMEHFGIVTAEAMTAGCVPVVINKGGQPEIVGEGAGQLWNTLDECGTLTLELIADTRLLEAKRYESERRSRRLFSLEALKSSIDTKLRLNQQGNRPLGPS